jgi:hypothetical protein
MYQQLVSEAEFIVCDYDGTLAQTHLESPNGLNVSKAYARSLDEIFGTSGLLDAIGGLRNRAPGELIAEVLRHHPSCLQKAREYYNNNHAMFRGLMPEGKGIRLHVAYLSHKDHEFCTELLVRAKLVHLNREQSASPLWPRPFDGAPEFLRSQGNRSWGLMSTGHDSFIFNSLDLWDAPRPRFSVTDDDVRQLNRPVAEKTKPSRLLFDLLHTRVRDRGYQLDRAHILYIGDDPRKDGELAANSGVKFLCFNPEKQPLPRSIACFSDWGELAGVFAG